MGTRYVALTMLGVGRGREDTSTKQYHACAWGSVRLDGGLVCGLGCAKRPWVPSCPQRRHFRHVRKYFSWVRLTPRHLGPWLPLAPSAAESSPGPWPPSCHLPSTPDFCNVTFQLPNGSLLVLDSGRARVEGWEGGACGKRAKAA